MSSLSNFFKSKPYIFICCDHALRILEVNDYTKKMTVTASSVPEGPCVSDYFHESDRQDIESILSANNLDPSQHFTHRWRRPSGRYMWCRWHAQIDQDSSRIYLVGEDVSEQKRTSSALSALEAVTNTGYWEIDLETGVLFWSDKVHEIHETDPTTFKPKLEDGLRFYPPQSIEKLKPALDTLEQTGEPYELDLDFITDKQKQRIVKAQGFSEKSRGIVVRNFGTFEDLTQKRQEEAAVAQLEQRIMLALDAAKIGVWEYDIERDRLDWDDRLFEIYGQEREDFSYSLSGWSDIVHPDDIEETESKFAFAVQNQAYFKHTFRVITKSNEIRYVLGMASTTLDRDGRVARVTGVNIDLTQSENLKNELKLAIEEANQLAKVANQMAERAKSADIQKSIFLANMSHEIRTPISGVIGLLNMLANENSNLTDESVKKTSAGYIELAQSTANHLLNIIGNILDFSKVESGKVSVVKEPFNLLSLLQEITAIFVIQGQEKGIKVDLNTDNIDDLPVLGDEVRLKQVMYNILSNAIKFTDQGSVTIDASLNAVHRNEYRFNYTVTDTGCGIAADKIGILFNPFEQVLDASAARNSQGTGLGLAISQKLCELMNGSISVETEIGKGSTFSFSIELTREKNLQSSVDQVSIDSTNIGKIAESLSDTKVLVVEDNEINQLILCDMLDNLKVSHFVAKDGEEAIGILRRKPHLDIILMDCLMPRMDGYKATELIRQQPDLAKYRDIPIIALTANAVVGDKEKCLSHGMTDYMKKPVEKDQLARMLFKYTPKHSN